MPDVTLYMVKNDLTEDYINFINALNDKFEFNNKDKFEEEFFIMLGKINKDSALDLFDIENSFYELISRHAKNSSLEINAVKAKIEMERING